MNNPPKNCATVKTTIPRGAIIATIARSLFVISVPIVDNKTEIDVPIQSLQSQNH